MESLTKIASQAVASKLRRRTFFGSFSGSLVLTPLQYINLYKSNPQSIKSIELIPPVIGEEDFGSFKVTFQPDLPEVCIDE